MKTPKWKIEIDGGWLAIIILILGAMALILKGNDNWEWMAIMAGVGIFFKLTDVS